MLKKKAAFTMETAFFVFLHIGEVKRVIFSRLF